MSENVDWIDWLPNLPHLHKTRKVCVRGARAVAAAEELVAATAESQSADGNIL